MPHRSSLSIVVALVITAHAAAQSRPESRPLETIGYIESISGECFRARGGEWPRTPNLFSADVADPEKATVARHDGFKCGPGSRLVLRITSGDAAASRPVTQSSDLKRVVIDSERWFTPVPGPALAPELERKLLERYSLFGARRGGDRAMRTLFAPCHGSFQRPESFEFRWNPDLVRGRGRLVVALQVDGKDVWSTAVPEGAATVTSEDARKFLATRQPAEPRDHHERERIDAIVFDAERRVVCRSAFHLLDAKSSAEVGRLEPVAGADPFLEPGRVLGPLARHALHNEVERGLAALLVPAQDDVFLLVSAEAFARDVIGDVAAAEDLRARLRRVVAR